MGKGIRSKVVPVTEVPPLQDADAVRPVVLVVDDEPVIADTLAIILSRNGFATFVACDGKSALEMATAIPPDLLVSDVVMPEMTGIELAIAIVEMVKDCKVLLFSGQASMMDLLAEARDAGYNFATLTKPIHPKELLVRIAKCMEARSPADLSLADADR